MKANEDELKNLFHCDLTGWSVESKMSESERVQIDDTCGEKR